MTSLQAVLWATYIVCAPCCLALFVCTIPGFSSWSAWIHTSGRVVIMVVESADKVQKLLAVEARNRLKVVQKVQIHFQHANRPVLLRLLSKSLPYSILADGWKSVKPGKFSTAKIKVHTRKRNLLLLLHSCHTHTWWSAPSQHQQTHTSLQQGHLSSPPWGTHSTAIAADDQSEFAIQVDHTYVWKQACRNSCMHACMHTHMHSTHTRMHVPDSLREDSSCACSPALGRLPAYHGNRPKGSSPNLHAHWVWHY